MKPIDLYDAMEGIPDQYIEAAKPAVKRRGESRKATKQVYRDAETVSGKRSGRPAERHTPGRKDSIRMSTKQPVWQRIATAFAATAACAVFVGGGMFIAQQAKQNQQDSKQNTESVQNFLGGTGTIHPASDMSLMYDDSNFYFLRGQFAAKRSSGEIVSMQLNRFLDDIFWDGEQFYREEGKDLYRIDMQGNHADETPFYTIDVDAFQQQYGTEIDDMMFHEVRKLADGYYYVSFSVNAMTDETVNGDSKAYACIYQPATGQQDSIQNDTVAVPQIFTDGNEYVAVSLTGKLSRITLNPVHIETLEPSAPLSNYYSREMLANGCLYYMAQNEGEESELLSYGKIDLNTLAYSEILHNPGFLNFIPYDGKVYAINSTGSDLICADPDVTGYGTVYKLDDSMSTEQKNIIAANLSDTPDNETAVRELLAMDENYFAVMFDNVDASNGIALIDRKTEKTQIFTTNAPADDAEPAGTNILGGTGELHADGTGCSLIYDDSNVYFESYTARGIRNPSEQVSASVPADKKNTVLVCDGDTLYLVRDFALYRLNSSGMPESEPFFTVPGSDLDAFRAENGGTAALMNIGMEKLTNRFEKIVLQVSNDEVAQNASTFRTLGYLYNTETGACSEMPLLDGMSMPFRSVTSDDTICMFPDGIDGFCTFDPEKMTYQMFEEPEAFIIKNECLMLQHHTLYYLSPGKNNSYSEMFYCKYDLDTKTCTVISETPGFDHFVSYDGMIYAASTDGKQAFCADPELKNKTVLVDYEKDVPDAVKQSVQAAVNSFGSIEPIPRIDCADENYACGHLGDNSFFLVDQKTGTARFYSFPDSEYAEQNSTVQPQVTSTVQTRATSTVQTQVTSTVSETETRREGNIFGGWGRLYPVDWDCYGGVALYRDDINYYCMDSSSYWYSCPIAGGEKKSLPARISGAQTIHEPLISDGERVFTRRMITVSNGNAANRFDDSDIQAYLDTLNDDATDNGYSYECQNIWHVRNRYFLVVIGTNQNGNLITIEVWTDENGKIISHENAPSGISQYFCNANKTEILAIKDSYLDVRDCPGDEIDDKPDPLAYGKIRCAYSGTDEEYYYTEQGDLYTRDNHGQPVLITDRAYTPINLTAAPDHRFFYVNMDPLNFSLREWIGGSQDNEFYAPQNSSTLYICGFEETGNGGYNIVLSRTYDTDKTGYIFLDSATGQVVKEIL